MAEQHAESCPDHADCCRIVWLEGQRIISESHMGAWVPAGARLNPDYPEALQGGASLRWELAELEHLDDLGWDVETRRRMAFLGTKRQLLTREEVARKLDVSPEAIENEAAAKGWDDRNKGGQ